MCNHFVLVLETPYLKHNIVTRLIQKKLAPPKILGLLRHWIHSLMWC